MEAHSFIDTKEAARLLGLSPTIVRRLIRDGRLPAFRYGLKALRIDREDVLTLRNDSRTLTPANRAA